MVILTAGLLIRGYSAMIITSWLSSTRAGDGGPAAMPLLCLLLPLLPINPIKPLRVWFYALLFPITHKILSLRNLATMATKPHKSLEIQGFSVLPKLLPCCCHNGALATTFAAALQSVQREFCCHKAPKSSWQHVMATTMATTFQHLRQHH